MKNQIIKTVAITGGVCSGKSSGLASMIESFGDRGWHGVVIPETATELLTTGITFHDGFITGKQFNEAIFLRQKFKEDQIKKIAQESQAEKILILCDRGLMDIRAYSTFSDFNKIAKQNGETTMSIHNRYDGVFHLVTAAIGAEKYYTLENNLARKETIKEARVRDLLTRKAWHGREKIHYIDNSTDFAGKMNRLDTAICHTLGIPIPLEIEFKYLVKPIAPQKLPPHQIVKIEQTYLYSRDPATEVRVRRRTMQGSHVHILTRKSGSPANGRLEQEMIISEKEYHSRLEDRDLSRKTIRKERHCFEWGFQYCELDRFRAEHQGLWILEVEVTDKEKRPQIPPFLKVIRDVTDDPQYKNHTLALKKRR